jgi:hypothetical protein
MPLLCSGLYLKPSQLQSRVIIITPAGFRGFYQLGVCKYIKQHYDLTNYIYSGASAGAWNSLFLSFKRDFSEFQEKVLDDRIDKIKNIKELEDLVTRNILTNFNKEDFHLEKVFIGVTTLQYYTPQVTIYSNFLDLEDAVKACVSSSHIPFLTSSHFQYMYRNSLAFDGGFCRYPYLPNSVLNITPSMWNNLNHEKPSNGPFRITDYTTLFSRDKYDFNEMICKGYSDSKQNKDYLDKIFK